MVNIYLSVSEYLEEIPVDLPQTESESPIIIRVCPDWQSGRGNLENGDVYFSKEKATNCTPGGGSSPIGDDGA